MGRTEKAVATPVSHGWAQGYPFVTGTCPACGTNSTLFVGDGGHITCSWRDCPDPAFVDEWLSRGGANGQG